MDVQILGEAMAPLVPLAPLPPLDYWVLGILIGREEVETRAETGEETREFLREDQMITLDPLVSQTGGCKSILKTGTTRTIGMTEDQEVDNSRVTATVGRGGEAGQLTTLGDHLSTRDTGVMGAFSEAQGIQTREGFLNQALGTILVEI